MSFHHIAIISGADGFNIDLWECDDCRSIVRGGRTKDHYRWHEAELTPLEVVAAPLEIVGHVDYEEIRAWAKANGHAVADRGRIPNSAITAYGEAHP